MLPKNLAIFAGFSGRVSRLTATRAIVPAATAQAKGNAFQV